jgi:hypothetical protein
MTDPYTDTNTGLVRSEYIDQACVQVCTAARQALVTMRSRYHRYHRNGTSAA